MDTITYLVCGNRRWSGKVFSEVISKYPGKWLFVNQSTDLQISALRIYDPRYIFFLHWSWKVPKEITDRYECINFHMTDVPYGRGGSPLQNLIMAGKKTTKLSALRMTDEMDAGPVYSKEDIDLSSGTAEEIYLRVNYKAAEMIGRIISEKIEPQPQVGGVVEFKRRNPEESEMFLPWQNLSEVHDFIRMLDAKGYPPAYLDLGGLRFEFTHANRYTDHVDAQVRITER